MCDPKPSKSGKYLTTEQWDALEAAGYSEQELQADQPFGPIIFSYTRKMAIDDGVLVDLTQPPLVGIVLQAGFRLPLAMTSTAYEAAIGTGDLPAGQDPAGRLWDVLMVLRAAIRKLPPGEDRVFFDVSVYDGKKPNIVNLWCQVGPGDEGEAVLTVMLIGED